MPGRAAAVAASLVPPLSRCPGLATSSPTPGYARGVGFPQRFRVNMGKLLGLEGRLCKAYGGWQGSCLGWCQGVSVHSLVHVGLTPGW